MREDSETRRAAEVYGTAMPLLTLRQAVAAKVRLIMRRKDRAGEDGRASSGREPVRPSSHPESPARRSGVIREGHPINDG